MAVRRTLAKRWWKRGLETAAVMVASEPGRLLKTRRWREAGCCNRRVMAATGAPFARRHSNSTTPLHYRSCMKVQQEADALDCSTRPAQVGFRGRGGILSCAPGDSCERCVCTSLRRG